MNLYCRYFWEQRKISETGKISAGGDIDKEQLLGDGEFPVIANALTNKGVVGYYNNYKSVAPAITITGRGDVGHAKARYVNFTAVVRLLVLKPFLEFNVDFLTAAINKIHIWVESTGVPQLTAPQLGNYKIYYPNLEGQTKVGNFIKQIDNTIALHQKRRELIEKLKKDYKSLLLPRRSEIQPTLRFIEFKEQWKQRKLNEIANIIGGGTPSTKVPEYWDGNIDWFTPAEIGKGIFASNSKRKITDLGFQKSSAKLLPANKTILFTSRAGIGDMAILKKDAATNQGFQSLVLNEGYDIYFIYTMGDRIKELALKRASGSTFLEISGKELGKIELPIPPYKEQVKIGKLFKYLDDQTFFYQEKINNLLMLKKSYLQKMFL